MPDFRDAVTFWKDQTQKLAERNRQLYVEIDDAERTADKFFVTTIIFATLFLVTLGLFLL